ncbi:MAG: helix-turn-helix domain-containing protein [Muribaculaceae bacterium]|nr:helix-turn-helix domain-containing protein [Muribaculaceae bacterium]
MTKIENELQYQITLKRVEELMLNLPEDTPAEDPRMVELTLLGNLVADYDEEHYPIGKPSLISVIKLRMYEMGLNQASLSKLLGINPARISEFLSGSREPTLPQARSISQKLNIDPAIVLGV